MNSQDKEKREYTGLPIADLIITIENSWVWRRFHISISIIIFAIFLFVLFNFIVLCIYYEPNPCLINPTITNHC